MFIQSNQPVHVQDRPAEVRTYQDNNDSSFIKSLKREISKRGISKIPYSISTPSDQYTHTGSNYSNPGLEGVVINGYDPNQRISPTNGNGQQETNHERKARLYQLQQKSSFVFQYDNPSREILAKLGIRNGRGDTIKVFSDYENPVIGDSYVVYDKGNKIIEEGSLKRNIFGLIKDGLRSLNPIGAAYADTLEKKVEITEAQTNSFMNDWARKARLYVVNKRKDGYNISVISEDNKPEWDGELLDNVDNQGREFAGNIVDILNKLGMFRTEKSEKEAVHWIARFLSTYGGTEINQNKIKIIRDDKGNPIRAELDGGVDYKGKKLSNRLVFYKKDSPVNHSVMLQNEDIVDYRKVGKVPPEKPFIRNFFVPNTYIVDLVKEGFSLDELVKEVEPVKPKEGEKILTYDYNVPTLEESLAPQKAEKPVEEVKEIPEVKKVLILKPDTLKDTLKLVEPVEEVKEIPEVKKESDTLEVESVNGYVLANLQIDNTSDLGVQGQLILPPHLVFNASGSTSRANLQASLSDEEGIFILTGIYGISQEPKFATDQLFGAGAELNKLIYAAIAFNSEKTKSDKTSVRTLDDGENLGYRLGSTPDLKLPVILVAGYNQQKLKGHIIHEGFNGALGLNIPTNLLSRMTNERFNDTNYSSLEFLIQNGKEEKAGFLTLGKTRSFPVELQDGRVLDGNILYGSVGGKINPVALIISYEKGNAERGPLTIDVNGNQITLPPLSLEFQTLATQFGVKFDERFFGLLGVKVINNGSSISDVVNDVDETILDIGAGLKF